MLHHSLFFINFDLSLSDYRFPRLLESRAQALIFLFSLFFLLTWTFVSIRLFVRCRLTRTVFADDIFLVATLLSYSVYIYSGLRSVEFGIGSLPNEIENADDLATSLKYWFFGELFSILTVTLLRNATAIYLRQAAKTNAQRRIILALVSATSAVNLTSFFVVLFQCQPVQYFWTGWVGANGSCMDPESVANVAYVAAGAGAVTDWVLSFLPIWLLWNDDLNRRTKLSARVLMAMGFFAGIAALFRIPATKMLLDSEDVFFDCAYIAVSAILEPGLGIMALAAASFRPICPNFYDYGLERRLAEMAVEEKPKESHRPHRYTKSRSYNDFVSLTGSDAQPPLHNAVLRRHSQDLKRSASVHSLD